MVSSGRLCDWQVWRFPKINYLNEGNPALVTVNKVAAQRNSQLASVDVVGELGGFFQKDFLQKDEMGVTYRSHVWKTKPRVVFLHSPLKRPCKTWAEPEAASATLWEHPSSWAESCTRCGLSACAAVRGNRRKTLHLTHFFPLSTINWMTRVADAAAQELKELYAKLSHH